ncbi:PAS domain-containing sensor histidine kinase [Humibacillus sp. DSM 29435]|uniref:PAS domain-containing sensor histidine kinase n=1 Tax=Humibacillus sp. DSM 29435 TaxID=1869167 RepID=UPI0008730D1C|nr:ATP-binding protein [Humibacillus sp. DSM 29435]OFE17442.1 PAS domain-containing sensor histidine kinase [Humibacillus sp. DSM 29435]
MANGEASVLPDSGEALAFVSTMGDLLPDGLIVIGSDRVVRFANQEAVRILDCEMGDLVGRPLAEGLPLTDKYGRDWWAHTDPWDGLGTRTGHREKLLVGPAGQDVLVTARYVRGERGGPVKRILLGLRDAEARQRAERDQATVLSTVAHELRAPLTSVTGFTSSLLRRWDRFTDEQKRLMIETIEADATRLTRLITELLDISRLDSHSLNLRLGPVDLHGLLTRHAVRHELGRTPGAVRLRLGVRAEAEGLPELWADSDRLEQVFFNLIDNGLLHGDGVVTVTIDRAGHEPTDGQASGRASHDDDAIVVTVEDEGDGIPAEDRDKVFGRFWHGPSSASTGLGLYVVRGLVEAHRGTVVALSNEAGGARFVVRLPSGLPDVLDP